MRLRRFARLSVVLALLLVAAGCNAYQRNNSPRPGDPLYQRGVGAQPNYPPSYPPYPLDPHYVPGPMPGAGAPEILTPQPYPNPGAPAVPGPAPSSSGYGFYPGQVRPIEGAELAPTPGGQTIDPPFNGHATSEPPLAPKNPPKPVEKEPTTLPPDLKGSKTPEPAPKIPPVKEPEPAPKIPPVKEPETSPALPVGIPSFAEPKARIAVGLKPDTEGLDWLLANKYRTVVNLRRKGADDSADREQIEKRGMRYISIEMSPLTLNREMADEFNKLVDNPANQPVFVYDKDRTLTGVMWYLHYRLADKMSDDDARAKAELLGLKIADGEEQKSYWLAIQTMLTDKP
jgi:hypothetical protein